MHIFKFFMQAAHHKINFGQSTSLFIYLLISLKYEFKEMNWIMS